MNSYVLVKSYYGWGGDLAILAEAIVFAEDINAKLIVDWRGSFNNRVVTKNIFNDLFELDFDCVDIHEVCESVRVYPDYFKPYYLLPSPYSNSHQLTKSSADQLNVLNFANDSDRLIVISRESSRFYNLEYKNRLNSAFNKIKPNQLIISEIQKYLSGLGTDGFIGVHFRHGNGEKTVTVPDITFYFDRIDKILKNSPNIKILVCTDCSAAVDSFIERYGNLIFSTCKNYPPNGAGGMHYYNNYEERYISGFEAATDLWLLSKARYLIGTKSFFTYTAFFLSGRFDKTNFIQYSQTPRSFKPDPSMIKAFDSDYKAIFLKYTTNISDVFIDSQSCIWFQSNWVGSITSNYTIENDIKAAVNKIKLIRLY